MRPRYNLWIEMEGQVVISAWRVRLLLAIAEHGSITAAAEALSVPYRRAWERLKEMEDRLGLTLVETEVGGAGGGGAQLTAQAHDLIARFHQFAEKMDEEVAARFAKAFDQHVG